MVPKKGKSKRMACSQKYKIKKKVAEHNRKVKKAARKGALSGAQKKSKKDPGIPNLWPFKDKLLAQVEASKRHAEQEQQRMRERTKAAKQKANVLKSMADLASDATKRAKTFNGIATDAAPDDNGVDVQDAALTRDNSRKAYYREFRKVVEKADVILEVLDARDPIGTRAKHIEAIIREGGAGKKIILVLNKVDLVPKEIVEGWLTFLRGELPTVAFKASTQQQRRNLGQSKVDVQRASEAMLNSSESLGADTIINILKNYSRNLNLKSSITVGVIGFPNVGKSSLINSLKRAKVCNVGSTPGVTKVTQEITLDKNLKLIDCPGIVFAAPAKQQGWKEAAEVMLRNCVKVELLEDPVTPVELILLRASKPTLMLLYNIPTFASTQEFLSHIARAKGKLRRGGVLDLDAAARSVLQDWNGGKIPFYTIPPKRDLGGEAAVVTAFAQEFDVPSLDAELGQLRSAKEMGKEFVAMAAGQPMDEDMALDDDDEDDDDDDEMEEEEFDDDQDELDDMDEDDDDDNEASAGDIVVPEATSSLIRSRAAQKATNSIVASSSSSSSKQQIMTAEEEELNPRSNKQRAKALKQAKKFEKKLQGKMSDNVKAWIAGDDGDVDMDVSDEQQPAASAYDFGQFGWGSVPQ
ncbi:nuclear GTP-binding protein nug1 [Sorochytrium milnesiophthora]